MQRLRPRFGVQLLGQDDPTVLPPRLPLCQAAPVHPVLPGLLRAGPLLLALPGQALSPPSPLPARLLTPLPQRLPDLVPLPCLLQLLLLPPLGLLRRLGQTRRQLPPLGRSRLLLLVCGPQGNHPQRRH